MRCTSEPKAPANGRLKCSSNACQVSCLADYKFPSGDSALTLTCMNGRWVVKSLEMNEVPACERNYTSYSMQMEVLFDQSITLIHVFFFSDLPSVMQKQWNLHCARSMQVPRKLHGANVSNGKKGEAQNEFSMRNALNINGYFKLCITSPPLPGNAKRSCSAS